MKAFRGVCSTAGLGHSSKDVQVQKNSSRVQSFTHRLTRTLAVSFPCHVSPRSVLYSRAIQTHRPSSQSTPFCRSTLSHDVTVRARSNTRRRRYGRGGTADPVRHLVYVRICAVIWLRTLPRQAHVRFRHASALILPA